jgi:hypothetical protein
VCVPRRVDLGSGLEEALSVQAVALEIANLDSAGTVALDDVEAVVGDAAVGAGRGSAWRAGVGVDAEVLGEATLALDVAAGIERAGVEVGDYGAICRLFDASCRHLGP